jgi:predicted esterase
MSHEHHLTVQRTARYYTLGGTPLGQLNEQTTDIWFALHGFGQLGKYFIRRFDVVQTQQTLVVAPEGLSRLYLDGEYSKIGASWLTREDRDNEVSDYLAYLNQLWDTLLANRDPQTLRITLMGFSQGAATLCRWLQAGHIRADRVILWAGFFPNGIADVIDPAKLAPIDTTFVYGRQDEYIEQMPDPEGYMNRMVAEVPTLKIMPFEGKHTVEREVLQQFVR